MKTIRILIISSFILILLSSCVSGPPVVNNAEASELIRQTPSSSEFSNTSTATSKPSSTPSKTMTPTLTMTPEPTRTPTITPTAYALQWFTSDQLRPNVSIASYIQNPCEYLENRWGEGKSTPGTIVVPIMFHSIAKVGRVITDSTTISTDYFEYFMRRAKELGFSTITMDELVRFIDNNEKIPELSMILILDDRRPGVTETFMPYLVSNEWTLTLGWITTDRTSESLWIKMEDLAASGHLDIQSHGHDHIYIQDYTPVEEIEEEMYKPIEVIKAHFGTTPSAIIWPGGNFNDLSVNMAREAGFKLGFTAYSRGPLMYNWIPQGEEELSVGDPLMVLPRYWSTTADNALNQAIVISEAAKRQAESVKADELLYFETYCQP